MYEAGLREFAEIAAASAPGAAPDFRALFENAPGLYLVLDPDFTVVAVNDAWCIATLTARENVIGRNLFEIMMDASGPDACTDATASGVARLRESLGFVLAERCRHRMAIQKCEVTGDDGRTEEHYWTALNSPVVDEGGDLRWIIHSFEDLTETMHACRDEIALGTKDAERHKLDRTGKPFAMSVSGNSGWGSFP